MHYNLAIIGGGPAASAAAIHARQRQLSVCVIERETFPRDRPGETLHPGIEPILKQLGALEAVNNRKFVRHNGTMVRWDTEIEFQAFSNNKEDWFGYQAYRRDFDSILLEQARSKEADVYSGLNVDSVVYNNQRVTGVIADGKEISADYILDASGSWHWLSRQLKIPINYFSKKLIARYGYAQGSCPVRDNIPAIIADDHGWTWTAKVEENLYQWTRLNFDSSSKFKHHLPDEFKNLSPFGGERGADVTWRLMDQVAGPGFFIAGDAAAVLDPASSHGVLKAVMSGIQAADLVFHIIKKNCPEKVALHKYDTWLLDWFYQDVKKLSLLYKKLNYNIFS